VFKHTESSIKSFVRLPYSELDLEFFIQEFNIR